MKRRLAVSLVILASSGAVAAEPTTYDFAAGYSLEVEGRGPMYVLQLPPEVYRTVRRADLGDIRVFNGAGEIVPHSLRPVESDVQTMSRKEVVPFFPIQGDGAASRNSDLALHVVRNSAGTIVDIQSAPVKGDAPRPVEGYLLDLSGTQKGVRELEFSWRRQGEASMFSVAIQQSDDLQYWQTLVGRSTLAELRYDGQKVERRTIPLPKTSMKYLKLTWEGGQPLELTSVTGYSHPLASRQQREWVDLGNGTARFSDNQLVIDYQGNYHLPVTGGQILFPETNALARLALQSRPDEGANWLTRCEQVFYTLALDNALLQNEPCTFPATTDRSWRLVVKEDGAGLRGGNTMPVLQLGLRPSELVFLGRGAPPFLLAFGSGKLALEEKAGEGRMIAQTLQTEAESRMIGQARIGKKLTLGGEDALQPPPPARPWKKWLLWTVLVLGVALLAVMAKNLIGEMKKEDMKEK